MAQWQDLHGDADLDAAGAGRDRAGDAERRRQHRALRIEMELRQPHHIETPALGRVDLCEAFHEGVLLGSAGKSRKLMEHAKFHGAFLRLVPRLAGRWTKDSAARRGPAIMARMSRSSEAG